MNIIVLSPNADLLFNQELMKKLSDAGQIIIIKDICPLEEIKELFDNTPKIVAIDPDFCDWLVPKDIIEKMQNVLAICLQTTSFSWIDTIAAKDRGIPVVNLRGFSTYAVAEWALMMAMNVARKLPLIIKNSWKQDLSKHRGLELRGKTAGIIGLGNIGKRLAEICGGLGMEVVYWSRQSKDNRFQYIELEDLMKSADFIFPVLVQNKDTEKLISDDMIKSMKKTAIFTSIVHKIYNHDLVLQLAGEGKIYGYAFETEKESIFNFQGNVWAGPELAWCTNEAMKRNAQQWVETIVQATQNKYPTLIN